MAKDIGVFDLIEGLQTACPATIDGNFAFVKSNQSVYIFKEGQWRNSKRTFDEYEFMKVRSAAEEIIAEEQTVEPVEPSVVDPVIEPVNEDTQITEPIIDDQDDQNTENDDSELTENNDDVIDTDAEVEDTDNDESEDNQDIKED